MGRLRAIVLLVSGSVAALLTAPPAAAGLSGADRCRIAKLDAISAATASGLRCWTRAIRQGSFGPDLACILPEGRLQRAFARAEAHGACSPTALDAGLAIVAYVIAQGASSVQPLPTVTATPVATPGTTPSPGPSATPPPGCGNGVVEPGEHCDGASYCDAGCTFAFPSLCCSFGSLCIALADIPPADQCFLAGGTPRIGASCISPDPGCVPGQPCVGTCQPATFAPMDFCCDGGGACTQRTLSDTESLASLLLQCGGPQVVEGTCIAGSCVPGG